MKMKRTICILLAVIMLLSLAACDVSPTTDSPTLSPEIEATPTPLPEIPEESVDISSLSEYTIVYPQDYAS